MKLNERTLFAALEVLALAHPITFLRVYILLVLNMAAVENLEVVNEEVNEEEEEVKQVNQVQEEAHQTKARNVHPGKHLTSVWV